MRRPTFARRYFPRVDVLENRVTPATFVVNTTADTDDGVADAVHTTLREAINAANINAGFDEIHFNIPGSGVKTINVGSTGLGDLPQITDAVLIDGYRQPGAVRNTLTSFDTAARLRIELDGAAVVDSLGGLRIEAVGVHVTGLIINRFTGDDFAHGILIPENGAAIIEGNFIGTNASGTEALPNDGMGVCTSTISLGAGPNMIGDGTPAGYNVISGNRAEGIFITNNTLVRGNIIGDRAIGGGLPIPNGGTGIFVFGSANTIEGNLIKHNGTRTDYTYHHGVVLTQASIYGSPYDPAIGNNIVSANVFVGNVSDGIYVEFSVNNEITENKFNINGRNGISILDPLTMGNKIHGNEFNQNENLPIDLGANGPTANDADDADTGPNGFQNFPEITRFRLGGESENAFFTVSYRVPTTNASSYPLKVQFYSFDRGILRFEGQDTYGVADAGLQRTVTILGFWIGTRITAIAIDAAGNTSEFAPILRDANRLIQVSPTTQLITNEGGGSAQFTVNLTQSPAANVTLTFTDPAEGTLSVHELTFTPNGPRSLPVTVTGLDDLVQDGSNLSTIVFDPAVSNDPSYGGMTIPSVPVLNVDNDSEDVQIAVNAPTRVRPGDTFEYQVIIINLGASGVFNLSLSASSNPVGNFVDLERVTSPRRARSRIRSNQISLQVSVPAGQTQAVRIRARALPGSGGATFTAFASVSRGNDPAVTAQASTEVDVQAVIVTLNGQHTGESITTDVYAPVLTGFFGAARFHYTIGIVNPNAIMATGVNVTVLQGGGPNIVAGYVHKPGSSYQPLTSFGAEFDLADIPPGTTELSLTALADSSDIGDEYSVSASITGALKGTSFGTLKTGTANTNVKASIEYLFLAGLAALAGQEYLNQRRQRKRRQFGERISDYAAVDELFEKLVP